MKYSGKNREAELTRSAADQFLLDQGGAVLRRNKSHQGWRTMRLPHQPCPIPGGHWTSRRVRGDDTNPAKRPVITTARMPTREESLS